MCIRIALYSRIVTVPPSDERIKQWALAQRLACERISRKVKAERAALESLPDFESLTKESGHGSKEPGAAGGDAEKDRGDAGAVSA